jgi:immunoglobulin-binding protein 1
MTQNVETILDNIDLDNSKVSDLFDRAWKSQQDLYKTSDTSNSTFEARRKKTLAVLEHCKSMFEELGLFSENEGLEEVSTSELRYVSFL